MSQTLEDFLNEIGVVPTSGDSQHTPVKWPDKPKKMESKGWKPTYSGEEPPF